MKKQLLLFVQTVLLNLFSFTFVSVLQAQDLPSTDWKTFVNHPDNVVLTDTFKLQTFGDDQLDNWSYTTTGNFQIREFPSEESNPLGGNRGACLSMNSSLSFSAFNDTLYQNVRIIAYYRAEKLQQGDILKARVHRNSGAIEALLCGAEMSEYPYDAIAIKNAYATDFYTLNSENSKGFYCFKYLLALGEIPTYSLFTGTGYWSDSLRWSHLPPARNRKALVDGKVIVKDTYRLASMDLASCSEVNIQSGGRLFVDQLTFTDSNISLFGEGIVSVSGQVSLNKTFEQKGKWYFISFPFDVYAGDVDADFRQGDETSNAGGNYFYVLTYNSDRRASLKQASGNWDVMPVQPDGQILFEKFKGYLIALDEQADRKILSFSSSDGALSDGFDQAPRIEIDAAIYSSDGNNEHDGWQLLGNPYPSPLSLAQLSGNTLLDGHVYISDKESYTSYPITETSQLTIPPFSSFFIKAQRNGILSVNRLTGTNNNEPLLVSALNIGQKAEPETTRSTAIGTVPDSQVSIALSREKLAISGCTSKTVVSLFSITGNQIWKGQMQTEAFIQPVRCHPGVYFLHLQSEYSKKTYKLIVR